MASVMGPRGHFIDQYPVVLSLEQLNAINT